MNYYLGNQIRNNEMGGTCSIYGRQKEMHRGFVRGNLTKREYLEDLGIEEKIIFK